jgi:hypothetical protein
LFETTTGTQARSIPKSQWQYKTGFIKEPRYSTTINNEKELVKNYLSVLKQYHQ